VAIKASDVTYSEAAPQGNPPLFPDNPQFWYETRRAFGSADYGASEFGEVLVTAGRIKAGDFDSWYDAWNDIAERVAREAADQLARGHKISARNSFLRASTYYRASEFFLHGNPQDPRIDVAYRKSVECYRACAGLYDPPIEPVEIPYEHTTLPGYLHRVDSSDRRRPLIILHTGFDGSAEEMHVEGALGAVERGYNVLAFDGPGQFGPLHREGLHFRPDWEKVVTPVVDFALKLPGVDPGKIALMGFSMGGYLAPRAAAFEKRIAALIANDGVFDYGAANLKLLPPATSAAIKQGLQANTAPELDRTIEAKMKESSTAQWAVTHGMYAMGVSTPSAYIAAGLAYTLADGVAEKISCPTLICDAEDDLFFKGQPQELLDHLRCPKTLLHFSVAEGAGDHCQVGAHRLALGRIYDWLDETLGGPPAQTS
jgi:pimeloyl-ACP methyl ester carboxylesterase